MKVVWTARDNMATTQASEFVYMAVLADILHVF